MVRIADPYVAQILELRESGESWRKIATTLCISRGAIKRTLVAAGHTTDSLRPVAHEWTQAEDETIIAGRLPLYDDDGGMVRPGMTGRELFDLLPHIPTRIVKRRRDYLVAKGKVR